MRRAVVEQAQRRPDDGVGVGAVPAGRLGLRAREPGPQHRDQQQVEQPVEHGLLPGLVLDDLVGEAAGPAGCPSRRRERRAAAAARASSRWLISPSQLVGADQHHGRAVRAVAPGAHAEVRHLGSALAVGRGAALAGVDDDLRRACRVVGDRVGVGPRRIATSPAREAGRARRRRGRSTTRRAPPRRASAAPRPGSAATTAGRARAEQEAPRARGPSRRPATASMEAKIRRSNTTWRLISPIESHRAATGRPTRRLQARLTPEPACSAARCSGSSTTSATTSATAIRPAAIQNARW